MRPNEFLTHDGAATGAHALGCQRSSCRSVRRGRGGDCMASDVDKVEREDPDTPGYLGGDRVRPEGCRRSRIVGVSPLARS